MISFTKAKLIKIFIIISFSVLIVISYDNISLIYKFLEENQTQIENVDIFAISLIFFLRTISIVIPILPGTYCSIIAGYIYGIRHGLFIIFIADFVACLTSFYISRRFGRGFIFRFLGEKQTLKIDKLSKQYLERNLFLLTGFLMTSWFDFVSYAIGLTKLSWKKFVPILFVSIIISDLPFVSAGHALRKIKNSNFSDIFDGNISIIEGPYLLILIVSAIIIFGIGIINVFINKRNFKY